MALLLPQRPSSCSGPNWSNNYGGVELVCYLHRLVRPLAVKVVVEDAQPGGYPTERLAGRTAGGPRWSSLLFRGPTRTSRPKWCCKGNPSWRTSQRWGNFGATRTTPTLSALSTSASSSVSSAVGRQATPPHSELAGSPRFKPLGPVRSAASVPRGRRRPMGWRRLLPARRGDGRTRTLGGQGSQVAHSCEQRGLQARARALCGQHQVDGDLVDRQPKPDHSATGK